MHTLKSSSQEEESTLYFKNTVSILNAHLLGDGRVNVFADRNFKFKWSPLSLYLALYSALQDGSLKELFVS